MLHIAHLEEINGHMLLLPDLVRRRENRDSGFARGVGEWLKSLETILAANRRHESGVVAALRSELVAAEQGEISPGLEFRGRPTRTRVLAAVATRVMQRATDIASGVLAQNLPRIAEGERIARQIVAVCQSRAAIPVRGQAVGTTEYLRAFRETLSRHTDLEGAATALDGLVGPHDSLILIDRALACRAPETPPAPAVSEE